MNMLESDMQEQKISQPICVARNDCLRCIVRIGWFGIWASLLLALLQGAVGITRGSNACLAIALQSICGIITSCSILITKKVTTKPATNRFPHGFDKIEFVAAGFAYLFFGIMASSLAVVAIKQLINPGVSTTDFTPILVAVVSIIANELLFQYMRCVADQANSQTIMASAWANRADAYAAAVVAVCALCAWMGAPRLDAIATLIVVTLVIKTLYKKFVEAIQGLLDRSVNDQYEERIENLAADIDGVHMVYRVQTRQVGHRIHAELKIEISTGCTIQDGQQIALNVRDRLLAKIKELDQVLVQFKPTRA
ncbi:Magnetosome protein MamM [Desulfovibrionales bacterium]